MQVCVCVCVCVCACTHLPVLSFLTLKEGNALKTPALEYLQLSGPCWMPQQILYADQPKNCWGMQATTIQHDKYVNLVCEKHFLHHAGSLWLACPSPPYTVYILNIWVRYLLSKWIAKPLTSLLQKVTRVVFFLGEQHIFKRKFKPGPS